MKTMKPIFHRAGRILVFFGLMGLIGVCGAGAADTVGKYQVVSGNEDQAYLVDTTTCAVWILTHRTMATGREPVAIPYKFIRISPQHRGEFLVELGPGGAPAKGGDAKEQAP